MRRDTYCKGNALGTEKPTFYFSCFLPGPLYKDQQVTEWLCTTETRAVLLTNGRQERCTGRGKTEQLLRHFCNEVSHITSKQSQQKTLFTVGAELFILQMHVKATIGTCLALRYKRKHTYRGKVITAPRRRQSTCSVGSNRWMPQKTCGAAQGGCEAIIVSVTGWGHIPPPAKPECSSVKNPSIITKLSRDSTGDVTLSFPSAWGDV